jgi:hypothetical protein
MCSGMVSSTAVYSEVEIMCPGMVSSTGVYSGVEIMCSGMVGSTAVYIILFLATLIVFN